MVYRETDKGAPRGGGPNLQDQFDVSSAHDGKLTVFHQQ